MIDGEVVRCDERGPRLGDPPKDEVGHFIRWQARGGWIDCRDLGKVLEHEMPSTAR
jgi:hypothetical protein